MSNNDVRTQRQREQDERRLSVQRNNAYFSFKATENNASSDKARSITPNLTEFLNVAGERARSCSPSLPSMSLQPKSAKCAPMQVCNNPSSPAVTSTAISLTTSTVTTTTTATISTASLMTSSASSVNINTSAAALPEKQNNNNECVKPAVQTGMDRYIQIKRKLSPLNSQRKITRGNTSLGLKETSMNSNRFKILADAYDVDSAEPTEVEKKKPKPPPVYIREKNSNVLVNKIIELIGKDNFHIIPLVKGNIQETKVQMKSEDNYRVLSKYLTENKKNFYTYQLKSSKGLQVVLKGIESDVTPEEITKALQEKGFTAKTVFNILNRDKKPQPLFKVELEPENKPLKKYEVHPIYNLQFLLHRRITVEEPHKRNGPVQCSNCQEYGHTRSYCKLRPVCVVCGEHHDSAHCPASKDDCNSKKCGNCGGNHTANYRGCPVYKELKSRIHQRGTTARTQNKQLTVSRSNPEVFFSTAARSSLGPINSDKTVTYASALKSGLATPASKSSFLQSAYHEQNTAQQHQSPEQPQNNFEALICSLQQSLTEFMSFMRTTMQDLMRNQNLLIQMLVSQQSK